jgi:hypothetical protein
MACMVGSTRRRGEWQEWRGEMRVLRKSDTFWQFMIEVTYYKSATWVSKKILDRNRESGYLKASAQSNRSRQKYPPRVELESKRR